MALNFPPTPSNGDYDSTGKWQFSSTPSPGVWKAVAASPTVAYPSPTAPANPKSGDLWYNTSNGLVYVYYTDQDTSQWVEIKANSALGTTLGTRVDTLEVRSPNYAINGGFDIWQRGVGPVSAGAGGYAAADRWWIYNGAVGTTTVAKETTIVPPGLTTSYKLTQTVTASPVYIMQSVETLNAAYLAGKTVTLSAYVYGAVTMNFVAQLMGDPTVDKTPSSGYSSTIAATNTSVPAGTWTRITATGVVPAGTKTLRIDIYAPGATLGQPFYFAGVQLEEGITATPFRRNAPSIQGELAACQRYYYRWTSENSYAWLGIATGNGSNAWMPMPFPVTMRASPSTTPEWSGSLSALNFLLGGTPTSFVYAGDGINRYGAALTFSGSGFPSATIVRANSNTGLYFGFSAEL